MATLLWSRACVIEFAAAHPPGWGLASALRSHTSGLKLISHRAVQKLGLLGWHSCSRTGFGGGHLQETTGETLVQGITQLQSRQAAMLAHILLLNTGTSSVQILAARQPCIRSYPAAKSGHSCCRISSPARAVVAWC